MNPINITIIGRIPSKKNSRMIFVRGGKRFNIPSQQYKEWHKDAMRQLNDYRGLGTISNIDLVELHFYAPDKRKSDLTNKAESIMDALVDFGTLEDDNWFQVGKLLLVFAGVNKENPRCEIFITVKEE